MDPSFEASPGSQHVHPVDGRGFDPLPSRLRLAVGPSTGAQLAKEINPSTDRSKAKQT